MSTLVVVKIGSSSITDGAGVDRAQLRHLVGQVVAARGAGHRVVVVTSGAIATGLPILGLTAGDGHAEATLRAASAVGQITLMSAFRDEMAAAGVTIGQVLLAPTDFMLRRRYLKSRGTFEELLARGVVPVVNENDAIADDEIRFGDNDRLAALVAHLIDADLLVLLTDTAGVFTADPRLDESASLIEEIVEIDQRLLDAAGGSASSVGRGGMASKLAAASIAGWSGVDTVIAAADRDDAVLGAIDGRSGLGTRFRARSHRLGARRLWIAFAVPASGRIVVDAGARRALEERKGSLLPIGIRSVDGAFVIDDAVEVVDPDGQVFAKGRVRWSSDDLRDHAGKRTGELPDHLGDEVIHRDDLVVLPA